MQKEWEHLIANPNPNPNPNWMQKEWEHLIAEREQLEADHHAHKELLLSLTGKLAQAKVNAWTPRNCFHST